MWIKNGRMTVDLIKSDIPEGEYFTIQEYAEHKNCPASTVKNWISRGQIECYRIDFCIDRLSHCWLIPVGVGPKMQK